MNIQRFINKCVRDKNNRIVIWQRPSPLIIGWFACTVAAHLLQAASLRTGFARTSTLLLFAWAYLEITQGASYFRRLLGIVVVAAIVVRYFS